MATSAAGVNGVLVVRYDLLLAAGSSRTFSERQVGKNSRCQATDRIGGQEIVGAAIDVVVAVVERIVGPGAQHADQFVEERVGLGVGWRLRSVRRGGHRSVGSRSSAVD